MARRQSDTNLCQGGDALDTDPLASTACGKRWCLRMYSNTRESNHATTPGVSTALAAWLVSKEGWLVASNSVTPQPHCLRNNETTPVSPNTDIRSCSCSEHGYASSISGSLNIGASSVPSSMKWRPSRSTRALGHGSSKRTALTLRPEIYTTTKIRGGFRPDNQPGPAEEAFCTAKGTEAAAGTGSPP